MREFFNDTKSLMEDSTDVICVNVPLFIRLLEYAREDSMTDMDLHYVAEKAAAGSLGGNTLTMDDYESLVPSE